VNKLARRVMVAVVGRGSRTFRLDITNNRLLVSLRTPHVTFPANAGTSRRMFLTRGNST